MRICLGLLPLAIALAQAPSFRADRVLPSNSDRQVALSPGMLVSIYGENLGPASSCAANADPHQTETPDPARPWRNLAIYPQELCGVQVFLAGRPAGLLYVSEKQINFKVPQDSPVGGEAELKVVHQGLDGAANVRVALESTSISVEGDARVGGPVWIHVELPYGWGGGVQYPVRIMPGDFGCNEFEVRRNGNPLPRIAVRPPAGGISFSGPPCGNLGFERPVPHLGRLPLHLQYRFTEPGLYEVRYTLRRMLYPRTPDPAVVQSEWTQIRVLPRTPRAVGTPPAEPAELLSDYLPALLGFSDRDGLDAVVTALYHPHPTVRRFAVNALGYWPKDEADVRVDRELAARGPNDMTVEGTLTRHPEMLSLVLPDLKSNDPVRLRGAVTGVSRWIYAHPAQAAVETEFLAVAEHVIQVADEQTVTNYAAALGSVRDPRAGTMLWDFVGRGVAREQSLIAICWRKDPRDLPRLATMLEPVTGDPMSRALSSLPYALRNSYGEAALPYLESALKKSRYLWVRTNCARELIVAGRPAGFAFVAQAIEQKASYAREMIQFIYDRYPELRGADDAAVLAFLRK